MRYLASTLLSMAVLLVAADETPPLGETIDDGTYHLSWRSTVTQTGKKSWTIQYTLHNQKEKTAILVQWLPQLYDGWLRYSDKPKTIDTLYVDEAPEKQEGELLYHLTLRKKAPSYRRKTEEKIGPVATGKVRAEVALTVKIQEEFQDVIFAVTSQVEKTSIRYTLDFKQKNLADSIAFSWKAAASPQLQAKLEDRFGKEKCMKVGEKGNREYILTDLKGAKLRNGEIVVVDREGKRLGAAAAPAFVPYKP